MTKKRKVAIIIGTIIIILLLCMFGIVIKNKYYATRYSQLNETDQKMLAEYNQLYEKIKTEKLWTDFDLADKPILTVSRDSFATYLINPKKFSGNLFSQKIAMPEEFKLQSVYRIVPIVPQILKIRFDVGSSFNTIGEQYSVFGNNVYYVKYDNKKSFEMQNTSSHFAPFLAHESFHYYMQNKWKMVKSPENTLNDKDMALLKKEYQILDNINTELQSQKSHEKLITFAKQYVDIVSKRIESNKTYVLSELSYETAEGTAQYLTIKASKIVGYNYGIMYFDNVTNVPMSDVFRQIEAGNFSVNYLYDKMPYQTGALLCLLFDELEIPKWKDTLNSQTLEHPVNLYDVLKEYVSNL